MERLIITFCLIGFVASCAPVKNRAAQKTCSASAEPRSGKPDMVFVSGGITTIGSDRFHPEEAPQRRVHVKGFWIDRYEVTNREFANFVRATGYVTTNERMGGGAVFRRPTQIVNRENISAWWRLDRTANWRFPHGRKGAPAVDNEPVVQVTFDDAVAFANWRGGDLPTEEEWERAARGGLENSEYTWGNQPEADKHMANHWQGIFPIEDTGADGFKGMAPVGCFPPNGYGSLNPQCVSASQGPLA